MYYLYAYHHGISLQFTTLIYIHLLWRCPTDTNISTLLQ